MSGRYTVDEKEEGTTLLTKRIEYEASGYMIIDEKCITIEIMEKKKDDKTEFLQWKKIDKRASQEHKAQVKGQN